MSNRWCAVAKKVTPSIKTNKVTNILLQKGAAFMMEKREMSLLVI
jgi:hypothetical protein